MEKVIILFIFATLVVTFASDQRSKGACGKIEIVSRKEWRSRPQTEILPVYPPLNKVIIAHTATNASNCKNRVACIRTVKAIETYHVEDMGWLDIAYNFLVGGDGRVYEGAGWVSPGVHTLGFNRNGIGIAFIGNYMEVEPSQIMLDAAQKLIACGIEEGMLTPACEINGHRDVTCILSPGDKLYDIIKKWNNYKGGRITGYTC